MCKKSYWIVKPVNDSSTEKKKKIDGEIEWNEKKSAAQSKWYFVRWAMSINWQKEKPKMETIYVHVSERAKYVCIYGIFNHCARASSTSINRAPWNHLSTLSSSAQISIAWALEFKTREKLFYYKFAFLLYMSAKKNTSFYIWYGLVRARCQARKSENTICNC